MLLGQLYGLEKFWAYLKYSQSKTQSIDPKLQEYLCSFKKLEDFRVDVSFKFFHCIIFITLIFELFGLISDFLNFNFIIFIF